MNTRRLGHGLLASVAFSAAVAEDLPLPLPHQPGLDPLPRQPEASSGPVFLKPTTSIKVPAASAPALGGGQKFAPVQKSALADQREVESRVTAALKRIVVMQGGAGRKLDQKVPPPNVADGKAVTLIGINAPKDTVRNLEGFFGVQLTPDNEKKVLETLRKGMAGTGRQSSRVEVLGWWPEEGVMAVGVSPEG